MQWRPFKGRERLYGSIGVGNGRGIGSEISQESTQCQEAEVYFSGKLAKMSGVSFGSVKRFETTGQISLLSLTKIAMALDMADELRNLFTQVPYKDIQEVINENR